MARNAKRATRLEAVPELPAVAPPAGGYSHDEFMAAVDIVRHQALVLQVRSRIAASAAGLPVRTPAEPVSLVTVRREARDVELEEASAVLRDAQAALDRRGQAVWER